jgi:hypothetical protein
MNARGLIEIPDHGFDFTNDIFRGPTELLAVDSSKLLPCHPIRHGVDVETNDVAADAVRFEEGRSTAHE